MNNFKLVATAAFGLESVVVRELKGIGFKGITVENGRAEFQGTPEDIARANIWLRTADRVLIETARFPASDFEDLFQGVLNIAWEEIIPFDGFIHVTGRSLRSKLSSVPSCQGVAKKAVIEAMKRKYRSETFPETGPRYGIEVSILNNIATIYLDTTGPGLHKRGYRSGAGEVPLKETLAAGLVYLSRWKPGIALADPFCGSGTIAIEAALIGRNIAPGIGRSFDSEKWPFVSPDVWKDARTEARSLENKEKFLIHASDIDDAVISRARRNARHAGVLACIDLKKRDFRDFSPEESGGIVICNPPYGESSGDRISAGEIYRDMGEVFRGLPSWSFFILTGFEGFEKFYGKHSDGNRKLYNARIKCYLYEYKGNR